MTARSTCSILLAAALALALTACGDDGGDTTGTEPGGDPADVVDDAGDEPGDVEDASDDGPVWDPAKSTYRMTIDAPSGNTYELDRDLTDDVDSFAFGSTHIAPAVSFAVLDTMTYPAYITVSFDFGKVIGSTEWPVHITEPDVFDFGLTPPGLTVQVEGGEFTSFDEGTTGTIEIVEYGNDTGQIMSGHFSGTLRHTAGVEITVEGDFHFILPEKAQGG